MVKLIVQRKRIDLYIKAHSDCYPA